MNITRKTYYYLIIFLIGLISVYDNVLTLVFGSYIRSTEQNPIGVWLINLSNGNHDLFISAKAISTILVVILCSVLINTKYRISILFVFLFQIVLFTYLTVKTAAFDVEDPSSDLYIISEESPVYHFVRFYTNPVTEKDIEDFTPKDPSGLYTKPLRLNLIYVND